MLSRMPAKSDSSTYSVNQLSWSPQYPKHCLELFSIVRIPLIVFLENRTHPYEKGPILHQQKSITDPSLGPDSELCLSANMFKWVRKINHGVIGLTLTLEGLTHCLQKSVPRFPSYLFESTFLSVAMPVGTLHSNVLIFTEECSPHLHQSNFSSQQMETFKESLNQSNTDRLSPGPKDTATTQWEVVERLKELEDQQFFCEIVSPRDVRSHIYKLLPTWLPKHELNKDDTNTHASVGRGAGDLSPKTNDCRLLRHAGNMEDKRMLIH